VPTDLTGRIGKYAIVRPLGRGAMGVVYLAHDTVLERDVALKVMVAQIADDPGLRERFEREAKAVARMTHPNVVNVFDLGTHSDGSSYIAMELLKGQDLQKAMQPGRPMSLRHRLSVVAQVLKGLAHAHEAGIVHRDIKPANIFIQHDGTVKIMDFGVARLATASMTGTGHIVGTADYMSPEQVKGARVDGRSDLFSVGCLLYELVLGRRPFRADSLMAIFYKILNEEPSFVLPAGGEHQDLVPILRRALAKPVEQRYQTAYEFANDLGAYLKAHASTRSGERALQELMQIPAPRIDEATAVLTRDAPAPAAPGPTLEADETLVSLAPRTPHHGRRYAALGAFVMLAAVAAWTLRTPTIDPPPAPPRPVPTRVAVDPAPTPVPSTPIPPVPTPVPTERPQPHTPPPPVATPSVIVATPMPARTPVPVATPDARKNAVSTLLVRATDELLAKRYANAMDLYRKVLDLEPRNESALRGLQVTLQAMTESPPTRAFVTGPTHATGPENEDPAWPGPDVRRTPPRALPGKILFSVAPAPPKPGAAYTVTITFSNPTDAPIEIDRFWITTTVAGGRTGGPQHPLPALVKTVAPRQSAIVFRMDDLWREAFTSWSMEATVTTARRETYVAEVAWK